MTYLLHTIKVAIFTTLVSCFAFWMYLEHIRTPVVAYSSTTMECEYVLDYKGNKSEEQCNDLPEKYNTMWLH